MWLTNYKGNFLDFFNDDFEFIRPKSVQDIPVNIKDGGSSFFLEAYLPGLKKENLSISLKNDYLTISYDHNENEEEKMENYLRVERKNVSFSRSFRLSGNIDQNKIKSELKDGILLIELPKKEEVIEKSHEKKITIG